MRWMTAVLLLFCCFAPPAVAMERFDIVTTQELAQMLAERDAGSRDFCLVITLDTMIYEHQSIPGSVNVPWSRVKELGAERLGPDRDRLIVTY